MVKVGFLGGGQMGEALIKGIIEQGFVASSSDIYVFDPFVPTVQKLSALKINIMSCNEDVVNNSDLIILAVKPYAVEDVLSKLQEKFSSQKLLLSICAGVTLQKLAEHSASEKNGLKIVRVMPNTPCMVGESASAYSLSPNCTEEDKELVRKFLESVGLAFELEEHLLDAVTGLSGSGPAFVAMFIEALADGGVRAGLPRQISQALAAQTVLGTASMVIKGNKSPSAIKDMVCSPNGTTIEGVYALESGGMRAAVMNAVQSAALRSKEIGTSKKS